MVVESPAAILGAARLQSSPRSVEHGGRRDREQAPERTVDAARRWLQAACARPKANADSGPARGGIEHGTGVFPTAEAVVGKQVRAQGLTHTARVLEVCPSGRVPAHEPVLVEPRRERSRIAELVDALLHVERVHEGAHNFELAWRDPGAHNLL